MNNSVSGTNAANPSAYNILFSCAGRRVGMIRAFRRALADLGLTGTLVGTDVTRSAPAIHEVDIAEIIPPVSSPDYLTRLTDLVRRHAIRLLVPLTDLDLALLSRAAAALAEVGCTAAIAPEPVVETCRDKIAFARFVAEAGLPAIPSMSLDEFRASPFFPCFAKPISGSSAIGTRVLHSEDDLVTHVMAFGEELMLQAYIPGSEYTMDVYRRRDGVVCAVVPRQRLEVRAGEVAKGITVNDPQLIDAAMALIDHLPGLWGVFNLQCRRPAGGEPHFFELNPRFGGGAPLTIAAGVDLPRMLIAELTGQTVEPRVGEFTDRLLMTRYDEAFYVQVDDPASLPGYDEPVSR
jgi:carbamoyl-phosphate synthase large subunit